MQIALFRTCAFICLSLLSGGCRELAYDPTTNEDVAGTPALEWKTQPLVYPNKTVERPYAPADVSTTIPLSELLELALYNNPSTRSSWNSAKAAAYSYKEAFSQYYPSVVYYSNVTGENNNIGASSGSTSTAAVPTTPLSNDSITGNIGTLAAAGDTQIDTYFNELTATWLMLDFGGRDAQTELAFQTLIAANWQHNAMIQQVLVSVLDAYTSYLGNKALVGAYEKNLEDAEVALKAAKTMSKAGLATKTDVLQAQAAVEQTRTNLIQSQGAEKTSFAELMIALGLPPETNMLVEELPQELPVVDIEGNVNAYLGLARQRRPDIGVAIAAVKQQEASLKIAYSSGMPVLTAEANLSRLHFIHRPSRDGHDNSISINLTYPLFQGFYYVNQQKQIQAQIQEALADLEVELSNVASQVVTNYYALETAIGTLPSSEANVEFSQRAYKGYLAQYRVGTASILDVLNSLTTLSSARAQLVVNRTQWAASLANLAFAVGILETDSGGWQTKPIFNRKKEQE